MAERPDTLPPDFEPDPHLGGYAALQHKGLEGVTKVDWILFAVTIYPSMFVLQFANNPFMRFIQRPGPRRAGMLVLLAVEVAVVATLVWVVTSR